MMVVVDCVVDAAVVDLPVVEGGEEEEDAVVDAVCYGLPVMFVQLLLL